MPSNLEEAEQKGRNKFEKFLNKIGITKYHFPENLQSIFDCEFTKNNKEYIVEIKHRSNKYSNYDDLLLEKNKFDNLKKIADKRNCKVLYIHTYEDSNKIKVADITNKEFVFKEQYQQKSHLWNTNKIPKLITYLKNFKEYLI